MAGYWSQSIFFCILWAVTLGGVLPYNYGLYIRYSMCHCEGYYYGFQAIDWNRV